MADGENDELFDAAVFVVKNLPKDGPVKTSNDEKLHFYGLYKQATDGNCNAPKPNFYDLSGVYKWNAWNSLQGMDHITAKQNYVQSIVEKIRNVQESYKPEERVAGEIHEILAPKLAILGVLRSECSISENITPQTSPDSDTLISRVDFNSDGEYADALEEEDLSRSSSFTEPRSSKRHVSVSIRSSCLRLELELKSISEKLELLEKTVEERHDLLLGMMKKSAVYGLVPQSWRTIIFFIFWPFVVHFLLKWFRRFFALFKR